MGASTMPLASRVAIHWLKLIQRDGIGRGDADGGAVQPRRFFQIAKLGLDRRFGRDWRR